MEAPLTVLCVAVHAHFLLTHQVTVGNGDWTAGVILGWDETFTRHPGHVSPDPILRGRVLGRAVLGFTRLRVNLCLSLHTHPMSSSRIVSQRPWHQTGEVRCVLGIFKNGCHHLPSPRSDSGYLRASKGQQYRREVVLPVSKLVWTSGA